MSQDGNIIAEETHGQTGCFEFDGLQASMAQVEQTGSVFKNIPPELFFKLMNNLKSMVYS